jgi:branched-chain amino acid transport system substrate-binding protein
MSELLNWRRLARSVACGAAAVAMSAVAAFAQSGEPIKIGFSMSLTGPLAANGKMSLVAMKIWEEDVNAAGGLMGRPVKLIYYDDQSSPAQVPGIYTKLLDVDKVDFAVSAYASTQIAPAMPIMIQKKRLFISLFGTGINDEFNYDKYFSMLPTGPTPKPTYTKGFFEIAMAQNPKPTSVAIAAADAEFGRNACDGARENAKNLNLKITYDRTYPPSTTDFAPIVRAIQAGNPDLVVICSYPLDSVGMIKAINEIGFKPKMIGGAMVGLQATVFKTQLGPLLNGIVNYETWIPVSSMQFPGSMELLKKYQARAAAEGVDPLGYYMPVWAYAYLQVLGDSIKATNSLKDDVLADHIRKTTFKTTVGDVKFGAKGEWDKDRMLYVQFQNIKGNSVDEFKDLKTEVLLYPPQYKSGDVIYPFEKAKQ